MVLSLVLDNLRSIHNVGSIIRTANGFDVLDINFIGTTPYPQLGDDPRPRPDQIKQTRAVHKTALGAEKFINGRYFTDSRAFLEAKNSAWPLLCLEQTDRSLDLKDYRPAPRRAYLVVGSEVTGVSPDLAAAAQTCLEIAMRGQKESLNVAVALGIALWHLADHQP